MRFYRYFRENPPPGTERMKSNDIIQRVCDFFGHPIEFVMQRTRKQEYVKTRYIIAYILAQDRYLHMSLVSIAYAIGKRDHTTIIHGLKQIANELELYEDFREIMHDIFVYVYGSDAYFPDEYRNLLKKNSDSE